MNGSYSWKLVWPLLLRQSVLNTVVIGVCVRVRVCVCVCVCARHIFIFLSQAAVRLS